MKPFKVDSFRRAEPRALQLAARELGHGIQTRTTAELAAIRGELAAISADGKSDYTRGFLEAIEHVLAGLTAEMKHRAAIAEDVAASKLRKNAAKVLLALHAGASRPKDIAKRATLSLPAVSAELAELEREDLVERIERSAGEDRRTEPRALTIRGARLARELSEQAPSPAAEAARELAPTFVAIISSLCDEYLVARPRLHAIATRHLGEASGAFVCDEFLRHAEHQRLISFSDSALALTSLRFGRRIHDVLHAALSSERAPLALEQVRRLRTSAEVCFRATTASRDEWQLAFSRHGMRDVHVWTFSDARTEQLPRPRGSYHLVWEDPSVMSKDLDEKELQPFVELAKRRYCYTANDIQLPDGIERLELDASHVAG